MRQLRWQHSVRNMQSKRLSAIVDRAVWKKVTNGQPVRWDKEVERVWQEIGGDKDEVLSIGESAGHKTKVRDMIETREKGALRCKVDKEEFLKIYGGLKEGIGMKAYLHGPLEAAKNLKLRFRGGDLDLPERRQRRTTKREEEEVDKQNCPCGKAIENRTDIVAERELYQEERDMLEGEMRDLNKSAMESFDA